MNKKKVTGPTLKAAAWTIIGIMAAISLPAKESVTLDLLGNATGYDYGWANAVSSDGSVIAGTSLHPLALDTKAFLWENGVFTELSFLGSDVANTSVGMTSDGSAVFGISLAEGYMARHPVIWQNNETIDLRTSLGLPEGYWGVYKLAVSGDGEVIMLMAISGWWNLDLFRWESGTLTQIEIPSEYDRFSLIGLSCDGSTAIGYAEIEDEGVAIMWRDSVFTHLDTLPNTEDPWPTAVCDDGSTIVGFSEVKGTDAFSPFMWQNGVLTQPGSSANSSCQATGICGDGSVIVGTTETSGAVRGTMWKAADNWQPVYLDTLLKNHGIQTNLELRPAGISQDGSTIIGEAVDETTTQAFRIQIANKFGQYRIHGDQADTGAWLGQLQVKAEPWAYCMNTENWFYVPEEVAQAGEGWIYCPYFDALELHNMEASHWDWSWKLNKFVYFAPGTTAEDGAGWIYVMGEVVEAK